MPTWATGITLSQLPWTDITHVMVAFALPNADGTLSYSSGYPIAGLVSTAHSNNTRVYLSIGGAGASNANWTACSSTYLNTFVTNIMAEVANQGYDGVDIDWEFPSPSDKTGFSNLMTQLYSNLTSANGYDNQPRGLTFFISPGYYVCGVDWPTVKNVCEAGILSGYDYGVDAYNGPLSDSATFTDCLGRSRYACITNSAQMLVTDGFPLSKLVLGCPLYTKPSNTNVITVLQGGSLIKYDIPQDEAEYNYSGGTQYTDNAQSFCDKINWVLAEGMPGIGLWDLSQAYPPTDPSVSAIWSTIGGTASCLNIVTPSATPTPVVASTWRVNAGGPAYTDSLGNLWSADNNYSGGNTGSTTNAISNTSDPTLYQTERYGAFSYSFNVPPGSYQVTLKFAEIFYTTTGKRIFSVAINGTTVLSNFDIVADAGAAFKADDKVFNNINPSGGQITIQFITGSADLPKVSALQIIPQPGNTPTPTYTPSFTFTVSPSYTRSATPSFTSTSSRTASATPSITLTRTPSITPSASRTSTPSSSPSPTFSVSPSSTASPSFTATNTDVPPGSTLTATPTISPTFSASPTDTSTYTASPSATPSVSPSETATQTATPTASPSDTNSATPSMSPSPTLSFSATSTPSVSPSLTASPSSSKTATPSASPSIAPQASATFTPSISPSITPGLATPTFTPTLVLASPTAGPQGPLNIVRFVAFPNPAQGGQTGLFYQLSADAQEGELLLYSVAFLRLSSQKIDSSLLGMGIHQISLPSPFTASGTYYAVLVIKGSGQVKAVTKIVYLK